jgi:predicted transcriptional regulator
MRLIDDADVFMNRNRVVIFGLVSDNPGIGVREISRKTGIPFSTVMHHVRRLRVQGFIGQVR